MHLPQPTRYTRIVCGSDSIACSTQAGTQFLNFVVRLGIACNTQYEQDYCTVYRDIMPALPACVAFAIAIDLERYNLTGVIYEYYHGKYTEGTAPSHAWYTANTGTGE